MSKLLAPNGKPSNLTPEQYKLVRTPAFKEWFGDWENSPETASKIVDENGEPKVKWRGDNNPKNVFDYINYGGHGVYYFGDKDFAEMYGDKLNTYFIYCRNPFLPNKTTEKEEKEIRKILQKDSDKILMQQVKQRGFKNLHNFLDNYYLIEEGFNENSNPLDILLYQLKNGINYFILEMNPIIEWIKNNDYDGYESYEGNNDNIAVFNSTQIKLADGSNTTFDSNNPDIRYKRGGETKKIKFNIEEDDEEGRITISINGMGEVILVETYPEYEFLEDVGEEGLEELGVEEGDIIGKIEHLKIEDKYKGKGYAKLLMKKAIEIAKEKGLMPLYLNASPMGSDGLYIDDLTGFYESFGFEVFLRQGGNNLMILNDTYKNGGDTKNNKMRNKVNFSKNEEKDFILWMQDGNVSKNPDGSYSTQDAQWRNNLKDMDALKQYYFKEFLSGNRYEKGGVTKRKSKVKELSSGRRSRKPIEKVVNVRARGGFTLDDFNPLLDYYDQVVSYKKVGKLELQQIVGKNYVEDEFEFKTEKDRDYWYDILTDEQEKYFTIKNKKKYVNYILDWHDPYSEKAEDEGITKKSEMKDYFADEIADELRNSTEREQFIKNLDLQNKFESGGSTDDKHLIAKAIEFIIGSAIETDSIEIEPTKISFKRKNTSVYSSLSKKLIEDTIRMHGKSLKGRYADGGEAGFDDEGTSMLIYHEKKGNFLVPKNQIYLWLYEGEGVNQKLSSGEYDYVFYPINTLVMASQKGFIPSLKKIWTKKFQKEHKGSDKLLGVIKAFLLKDGKELYIDMMSVNPTKKKKGVMSYMIKDLRDTFNLTQDQVTFSNLTDEGKKFVAKKTYADGGGVGNIKIGDEVYGRWNNTNKWTSGIFKGETENGFEVYDFSIEKPDHIEYYAEISEDGYGGSKIYTSTKFKDRNYKNYHFSHSKDEYANGGWILMDGDTEIKIGEYETESEARKMMYEYDGNSVIVEKSKWNKYADGGDVKSKNNKIEWVKNVGEEGWSATMESKNAYENVGGYVSTSGNWKIYRSGRFYYDKYIEGDNFKRDGDWGVYRNDELYGEFDSLKEAKQYVQNWVGINPKDYADGGDVPHEDKMFQLPLEMVVYVPSTQDVDKVISVDKMDKRVDEVKEYLASKFGGYTSSDKLGGYVDNAGNLVNEDVVQVTSFSTKEAYNENKEELIKQLAKWGKLWGQEAIGFEFEGDLMYVPQEL